MLANLAAKHSERVVAVGVDQNGTVIELAASKDGKTWTLIQTFPTGVSCLVTVGEGWHRVPKLKGSNS